MNILKNSAAHAIFCVAIVYGSLAGSPSSSSVSARQDGAAPSSRSYDSLVATRPDAATPATPRPVVVATSTEALSIVDGAVFGSTDGGATWAHRGSVGGDAMNAMCIDGVWRCLLKTGRVLASSDGGRTWSGIVDLGSVAATGALAVCGGFSPAGEAWAAFEGSKPVVAVASGDAIAMATGLRTPISSGWRGPTMLVATSNGTVYRGPSAGGALEKVVSLQGATLNDISFADEQRGWIATGEGLVLETNDGGTTWLARPVAGASALDAVGLTEDAFWVVGRAQSVGVLYVSVDHGVRWKNVLKGPAPLSRPVSIGTADWLVDASGGVWKAATVAGPWRRVGALALKKAKPTKGKGK